MSSLARSSEWETLRATDELGDSFPYSTLLQMHQVPLLVLSDTKMDLHAAAWGIFLLGMLRFLVVSRF